MMSDLGLVPGIDAWVAESDLERAEEAGRGADAGLPTANEQIARRRK
jgi:hypothetical protein